MKRKLNWLLGNALPWLATALCIHFNSAAFGRVAIFLIWAISFLTVLMTIAVWALAIAKPEEVNTGKLRRSVPAWIDIPLDLFLCCICAYLGWFCTGAVYFIHIIFASILADAIPDRVEKQRKEAKSA